MQQYFEQLNKDSLVSSNFTFGVKSFSELLKFNLNR